MTMGRQVRMVPADWQHPTFTAENAYRPSQIGMVRPLRDNFNARVAEWDEENEMWNRGLRRSYGSNTEQWVSNEDSRSETYEEYAGSRPVQEDYMPDWPADQRTHFMMYEDTSEGTPISPAFATAEELARWLVDTGASAFADMTATYEQWLSTIRRGSAISAVMTSAGMVSGVAALAEGDAA